MIDGQHPVQVGLFPMEIKCHTPQQLRQLQEQHHQQQQQQQHSHHHQARLLMNGNAEMLTTSNAAAIAKTTTATTISTLNGQNGKCGYTTSSSGTESLTPTTLQQQSTIIPVQRMATSAAAAAPLTTGTGTATAPAASVFVGVTTTPSDPLAAVVNGSCSTNNNNNDKTIVSVNGDGLGLGPGPPQQPPPPPAPPPQSSSAAPSALPSSTPHTTAIAITAPRTTTKPLTQQTMSGAISTSQQALHPARTNPNTNTNASANMSVSTIANTSTSVSVCGVLDGCNTNNIITDIGCGSHCITPEQNTNAGLNMQHQHQHQQRLQMHMGNGTTMAPHHYLQHPSHHHSQPPPNHPLTLTSAGNNNVNCNSSITVGDLLSLQIRLPCSVSGRLRGLSIDGGTSQCNNDGIGMNGIQAIAQCGYCCQPICDRYIMRVVDTSFHETCLKCATCSIPLVHSCFAKDGKLYCRIDYERLFMRNRCLGCGHKIASDELVMRALENVFHLKCFACVVCGSLLKKGEQYVVKQGQLFCRFDYEKEVEMLQGYDFYGDDLFPPKLDGRRGPKRPRTILNTQQRRAFKASFEVSPKPCRKVRENLAKETGLSLRIVQVWFQNQRAKVKKIQKKAKQEHPKGTSDSQDSQESDSSLAKVKDEAPSDSESLLESPYFSCSTNGNHTAGQHSSAGSTAESIAKLRCIKDENENAPFNGMETDKENCNKNNEPILNTILGLSYATFQQLMGPFTQSPMVNPIDRLYSMQNSYFRPEELNFNDCGKELSEN